MKKFICGWIVIFCAFSIVSAQSGRRIEATPMPTPTPEPVIDYSETAPNKPRTVYPPNAVRRREDKKTAKKNSKTKTQTPTEIAAPDALPSAEADELIKVETSLITIPVSVFDRNGLYIPNLSKENFKIFEDGKEQEIAYFGTSEKPFTVVLLLDTSPSTEYKIEEIQRAAIAFVDQLKPQDSVMVIEFDANVHVLTEVTSDRQKIYKAIGRADFGYGTALYDAVDFSLRKRLSAVEGRKAIVLFTDGVDTESHKAGYDSTVREAEESDALVFPIYYNTFFDNNRRIGSSMPFPFPGAQMPRGSTSEEYALGKRYLTDLSEATGGKVFRPEATPGGLTAAFEGIAEELRRQYNIGYYPNTEGQAGQRKQIKVRVNRPNLVIRSRDSYVVGSAATQQNAK